MEKTNKAKISLMTVLILFAALPLLIGGAISSTYIAESGKKQVEQVTHNYMVMLADMAVENLEYYRVEEGQEDYLCMANLEEEAKDRKVDGVESSYYYIVNGHTGEMLWHPQADKIGKTVENDAVKQLMAEIKTGNIPQSSVITYTFKGVDKYAGYSIGNEGEYIVIVTADKKDILAANYTVAKLAAGFEVFIILLFTGIAILVARIMMKPLSSVTSAIKHLAEGQLDTETDIRSQLKETISLIDSANRLKTQLNEIIGSVKRSSDQLLEESENVYQLTQTSSGMTKEVSTVIEDLASAASTIANNAQSIDEQTITMGSDIEDILHTTEQLTGLSQEIKKANADASSYIDIVSGSSNESVTAVTDILHQVEETNEAIKAVQDAVTAIQSIATQTNLLALNASIEAARAGEAGRGFAVVATEIGNLSTQSNSSAAEISDIVKNIVDKSAKSVQLSSKVAEMINREQNYILDTQSKFGILNEKIENSLREIESISIKIDSLNQAKTNIIASVSDLSAISQENAASSEEASASVTAIASDIDNISGNSESTRDHAGILAQIVAYFH